MQASRMNNFTFFTLSFDSQPKLDKNDWKWKDTPILDKSQHSTAN